MVFFFLFYKLKSFISGDLFFCKFPSMVITFWSPGNFPTKGKALISVIVCIGADDIEKSKLENWSKTLS